MEADAAALLATLHDVADAVSRVLSGVDDWGLSGERDGQYRADLVADAAALGVLRAAGMGILSEESGLERRDGAPIVIVDPLDGSTNASRGVRWYATSLCAVGPEGPIAALVADQASGARYSATRGGGAFRDGVAMKPTACASLDAAIVGVNGWPKRHLGWAQYRAFGAAALDLCQVADGVLDAYVDCTTDSHGVWDYAAAALICAEAGVTIADARGRDLIVMEHDGRRTPIAAATPTLHDELCAARTSLG